MTSTVAIFALTPGMIFLKILGKLLFAALLFFLIWCFAVMPRRGHPKWKLLRQYRYAHRGFHDKPRIPENSLPAFQRAVDRGFGAELDVHLTKDDHLAVIHDSSLKRVCGVEGNVEDFTSDELRAFRLEGTENLIPFLEEVLPLFERKTPLVVEVKPANGNWDELTQKTVECLDKFSVEYCMESFDPRALLWLKHHRPEIVRGQLAQNFMKEPAGLNGYNRFMLTNLIYNTRTRPDFIAYKFEDRTCASPRLACHLLGGQEINWTIRSLADMKQAEKEGHLVIFEKFDPEVTD
ncbi:MAG: glycerophosphodiester phosphodiesterase [Oscillibacter sp.]|nr:glycerophosphodiester phosphodiesterase [Oscillibacter sp.]